jgi:hypothetical protein
MDQEEVDALVRNGFQRYAESSDHCDALETDIKVMAKRVLERTPGQHFINPRSDLLWFTAKHLLWRVYCVGSSGILYERSRSRVIDLPGAMGLPVCLWAIRKGLNTDDWSGILVLESFSEWEPTVRLLSPAVGKAQSADLGRPPGTDALRGRYSGRPLAVKGTQARRGLWAAEGFFLASRVCQFRRLCRPSGSVGRRCGCGSCALTVNAPGEHIPDFAPGSPRVRFAFAAVGPSGLSRTWSLSGPWAGRRRRGEWGGRMDAGLRIACGSPPPGQARVPPVISGLAFGGRPQYWGRSVRQPTVHTRE